MSMKGRIFFALLILIAVVAITLLTLALSKRASAMSEARVKPPEWKDGEAQTFAVYRPAVGRIATAYYRIMSGEYESRPIYKILYTAIGEGLTESATTLVDAVTLEPYKTARKYKSAKGVSFVDVSYGQGKIVVRRKFGEEGQITETIVDFPGRIFDYDELIWLIPQLDFSKDDRVHFPLFSTVGDQTILVVVRKVGQDVFEFHGAKFTGTKYNFNLNLVSQDIWVGNINGNQTVLKYDTGENVFYNLALLKGLKPEEKPKAEEKPKEEKKEEVKEKVEEEKPAPPEEAGKVYF